MPEAPEINVLINQLKRILKNTTYRKHSVVKIYRDNKTININLSNDKTIVIHLMLRGWLSLERTAYTLYALSFSKVTIFINDMMRLSTLKIVKTVPIEKKNIFLFLQFCGNHGNSSIKNALINFKIGVGSYLTKEIFGSLDIDPNIKCKNISKKDIKKIYNYAIQLIKYITSKHGKHTYKDIYGTYGKYTPLF